MVRFGFRDVWGDVFRDAFLNGTVLPRIWGVVFLYGFSMLFGVLSYF